jgi:DNA-binding NarL/FixJ family response regulator
MRELELDVVTVADRLGEDGRYLAVCALDGPGDARLRPGDAVWLRVPGEAADCPLTQRERDVVKQLGEAKSLREIGREMGLAHSTIRTHLRSAYLKLGLHDRAQAFLKCQAEGWV